jgi:hypothetical protein
MFVYRHDILKAIIAADVGLVVLGRNESLADLPELGADAERHGSTDWHARYLEYSPKSKLRVVGEENLLGQPHQVGVGDCQLVRVLGSAICKVTGTRPFDPEWDNRPRNVWRQYKLRVARIDDRLDEKLKELYDGATQAGKWQGTMVHDRAS